MAKTKKPSVAENKYPDITLRLVDYWDEFWRTVLGRQLTDADLVLPASYRVGFSLPVIKPPDVTTQQAYDLTVGTELFSCWKFWDDLGVLKVEEEYLRAVDQATVVLIRPGVEPDTRVSYDQAVEQRLTFLGLGHRIILEPFGFWLNQAHSNEAEELGIPEHLDVVGWTRTPSLGPGGRVAYASWFDAGGMFWVVWSDRGGANPVGGVRQAVC